MKNEPGYIELLWARLAFFLWGKSVYQDFADRLPLDGGERVLDFGCGMGGAAYYVAQKLPHGQLACLDISQRWLNACRKTLRKYKNITFLKWESPVLANESFDAVYCHFVLHDISESERESVIPALVHSLKPGGILVFREPLRENEKIYSIKRLMEKNRLFLKDSRITDVPLMGNSLESIYIKQ